MQNSNIAAFSAMVQKYCTAHLSSIISFFPAYFTYRSPLLILVPINQATIVFIHPLKPPSPEDNFAKDIRTT